MHIIKRILSLPLHPFLIAIYPVLALLGHNISEVRASVSFRALLFSMIICIGLLLITKLLTKNWDTAAVVTTFALFLFFTYGHFYNTLKNLDLSIELDRHRVIAPLWIGVFILLYLWVLWKKPEFSKSHVYLNLVVGTALIFPIYQLGSYTLQSQLSKTDTTSVSAAPVDLQIAEDVSAPDVYYIILDAYTRDDTLLSEYNLENATFLAELQELGFLVAACSQSNYAQTQLSLASSLNYNYLETLNENYTVGNTDRTGLSDFLRHSTSRYALESLGYQSIAFETGFKTTEWDDADIYLSASSAALDRLQTDAGLNDFELMLINTSAGRLLSDAAIKLPQFLQADFDNPRKIHRDRILYALDQLEKLPSVPGAKFVFAHLVIPHPPYVFGPDGEFIDYDRDPIAAYRDQVMFLNKALIPVLETIQRESDTPPIIVIQGDHGGVESNQAYRMDILNAYYLPEGGNEALYPHISPVNTFRVIFNQYFGGKFELLDDISYFSVYSTPFDYTIIPNRRPGCLSVE